MKTPQLCILSAVLLAISGYTYAAEDKDERHISTSGEASVYVVPDEAILTFGIRTLNTELQAAKAENDADSEKLTSAVRGLGIDPKHFATDNVDVGLLYNNAYQGNPGTSITGYLVTRTYMVTLKDISKLQTVLDTVLTSKANIFEGVTFRSTELRKYRDQARNMAIKAAKEKAVALAGVLDCTVGPPRSITETGGSWDMYRSGHRDAGTVMQNSVQEVGPGPSEGGSTPLGQIAIKANVSVVFDLVPGQAAVP